jgi:hypothetical protein
MALGIYRDIDDYTVTIGTIVAFTEGWCETAEPGNSDLYDFIGQVIAYDDESGEMGVLEITDKSGEWVDWHPNYAIPVQWEWNYRKYQAI